MMFRLVVILVSGIMLSSAAVLQVEAGEKVPRAIIETKFGSIELTFFPKKAPNHVENFLKLAKSGFYDGTIFHRIIPGFMIQGGDPNTKDDDTSTYGLGGPGYNLKAEFNNRPHGRGILSMARSQDHDSAGSQFYIVVAESSFLNGKYTVFGKVVKGMDVVDTIVSLDRDARDLPTDRIEMTVRIAE
ncbi:MAG TPA: peptidylprolyl isomerase [Nitrospirales bacterium]|nr:peptidylprolyl isomerase [Nitrospirales bacterium]